MAEHLSDQEQLEALKSWWKDNGTQWLITLILIVGGYFGWQGWQEHKREQTEQASLLYSEMLEPMSGLLPGDKLADEKQIIVERNARQLMDEHKSTQYARYAAMLLARLAVDDGKFDAAAKDLQWALDDDPDPALQRILRLRLARVEAARGDLDAALAQIQNSDGAEMQAAYDEAKGDFYLLQGKRGAAFTAYQSAISALRPEEFNNRSILEIKLGQLRPEPIDSEPAGDSEQEGG